MLRRMADAPVSGMRTPGGETRVIYEKCRDKL